MLQILSGADNKKNWRKSSVSGSAGKELGSCHGVLETSKKAEQARKPTVLFGSESEGSMQGTLLP